MVVVPDTPVQVTFPPHSCVVIALRISGFIQCLLSMSCLFGSYAQMYLRNKSTSKVGVFICYCKYYLCFIWFFVFMDLLGLYCLVNCRVLLV